jgi:hypothetical protein
MSQGQPREFKRIKRPGSNPLPPPAAALREKSAGQKKKKKKNSHPPPPPLLPPPLLPPPPLRTKHSALSVVSRGGDQDEVVNKATIDKMTREMQDQREEQRFTTFLKVGKI